MGMLGVRYFLSCIISDLSTFPTLDEITPTHHSTAPETYSCEVLAPNFASPRCEIGGTEKMAC